MIGVLNSSKIVRLKSKFFLTRFLLYFSFLLIPVWIQKTVDLNRFSQTLITILYCCFMFGQWYLMGKEIDHRLKIYFRANSSIDRVTYRLIVGGSVFIILFNLISIIPWEHVKHFFWGIWVVIGLYYSWPTRGKIIEESMSGQLIEFHYLDVFEKSVLFIFAILFFVSIPDLPRFENIEAMKLVFDPKEKIHVFLWSFLEIFFFPFYKNPKLYSLAWSLFFYLWGGCLYFLALYSLLRFLFSRRIAILGLFALISTWSVSKIVNNDLSAILTTTLPVVWIWSHVWSWRSSTYRSGLLLGLTSFLLYLINSSFIVLYPVSLVLTHFVFLKRKTLWYRQQMVKYSFLGLGLTIAAIPFASDFSISFSPEHIGEWVKTLLLYLDQKAFFVLSVFGVGLVMMYTSKREWKSLRAFKLNKAVVKELGFFVVLCFVLHLLIGANLSLEFSMLWWLTLFALVPVELIFQSISKLRSKRNLIYFVYVLVCLLDSHFEGRIKIILKFFS